MAELIIIAGPQAAGKSTVITTLASCYQGIAALFPRKWSPLIFPLQESRQIIVHKYLLLGAVFMSSEQEREIVNCDLARMELMLQRARDRKKRVVYLDECNIFTLAHAAAHGIRDVEKYWDEYVLQLQQLSAKVIFLNIPPELSWERRSRRYEQRLIYFHNSQHASVRVRYRDYLVKIHPLLLETYERLPFPKVMIDATYPEKKVMEMVSKTLAKLSVSFR